MDTAEVRALAHNWWAFVVRGVAGIIFGVLAFVWPGLTLAALIILFGAYALVDGIFDLVGAIRGVGAQPRWLLAVEGIVGVAAGIVTFAWPGLTALVLAYVIAGWAIVTGVLEIAAAIRLRKRIQGEWALIVAGVLSILFGLLMAFAPAAGALALVLWIGAYAVIFGALLVVHGFRLRRWRTDEEVPLRRAA